MTMKFTQLRTHWNANDAHDILSLLDELREALWETYGAEIIEQRQQEAQQQHDHCDKIDDVIDF